MCLRRVCMCVLGMWRCIPLFDCIAWGMGYTRIKGLVEIISSSLFLQIETSTTSDYSLMNTVYKFP